MSKNDSVLIYTDGSSRGNPGPGGWGSIVVIGNDVKELGGAEEDTTNNRMELSAVISALSFVRKKRSDAPVKVFTDSTYVVSGITGWIFGWKKNDWKTQTKSDVLNKDLWQELDKVVEGLDISWFVVKGHAGIEANERVDQIATMYADKKEMKLFDGSLRDYTVKVTPPSIEEMEEARGNDRRKAKAYSYLSLVDGKLARHETWAECEERVKGKSNVKFRKTISKEDEDAIKREWGVE